MEQNGTVWNVLEHFGTCEEGETMREDKTRERETIAERIKTEPQPPAETETEHANYEIYNNIIYGLVDSFIDAEYPNKSQEELKQDKAFFPRLTHYLYNNYIGELLGNKYGKQVVYKDIHQLDILFNIYLDLVYKYKWNNKPFIVEFALFVGINKNTFYNWLNGLDNNNHNGVVDSSLTLERSDTVSKWVETCERALLDGNDTIRDIFILKAKHGYRDNNNDVTITVNHKAIVNADVLPDLIGISSKN